MSIVPGRDVPTVPGEWTAAVPDVDTLEPGDRVRIDAPWASKNHGRFGNLESASESGATVLLDGDTEPWLFARRAVKRVEAEADDA